jgi:ribosomal protein L29
MKFSEIKDLTTDELRKKDRLLKEELFEMTMKHSLGQLGSPIEIRGKRRQRAQVMTALNLKLGQ